MKIRFIGTGSAAAKDRALTSFLINDEILFDIGAGTNRRLQELGVADDAIKTLIISHFHGDHVSDLSVWLLRRKYRTNNTQKLTIITPAGGQQQISDRMQMDFGNSDFEPSDNIEIIELSEDTMSLGGTDITAHKVEHAPGMICNGITIRIDGKTLGLSGDAGKCDGLDKIVEVSNMALLDAIYPTFPGGGSVKHLGVEGVLEYAKQYPEKRFYLVHRTDYDVKDLPKNVFMPDDGEEVEL